ncbi:zinc finger protein ZAT1-like [Arachis duranensis]|uniref:Zinc finger protein ZAT1-like n=1 Tax=Arachis duranensis TaxID=130453 RepID=A0A6P4DU46_ARADU|nr:zinc finger protein ZAT1-like [Arachis duranensis]
MEKNNNITCKICNKCFSTGKAIGGHMRSHLVKLPIPPKPDPENQALDNSNKLTNHAIQAPSSMNFHPEKKPAQNLQSPKHSFLAFFSKVNIENRFLPYPKNPTRKRSKCRRQIIKAVEKRSEPKQESSTSETPRAKEAARSLILLSKDNWPASKEIKTQEMEGANQMFTKDNENGKDALLVQTPTQVTFRCLDKKTVECPSCSKMFKSKQALGGHKKVHLNNPKVANAHNKFVDKSLDLNFPAFRDDEDVGQINFPTMGNGK